MLTFDNLSIRQDDFQLRANFTIQTSCSVAVIGPSGSGKSTLLNATAGFVEIEAGRLRWNDQDLAEQAPGNRPISMVFQDNNLFPHLTAAQNVALGIRPSLKLSTAEEAKVAAALTRVGLPGVDNRKPASLSGGQQSRVTLARVLMQDRPVVLLDEPFSALGPALKNEMLDLVAELTEAAGATLLMVSHDPGDALRIADQTVLVADGIANGPIKTSALFDNPPEALKTYLGSQLLKK